MKNRLAALVLASLLLAQAGILTFANEAEPPANSGPITRSGNTVWSVFSFPLRLITGATGFVVGAVDGGAKGIVKMEETFAENTFAKASESPLLVPIGLVGTIVALPVGLVSGAPDGAAKGAREGYRLWDHF